MKPPDLAVAADAGVREWSGAADAIKPAAAAAKLKYCVVDLQGVGGKNELLTALSCVTPRHTASRIASTGKRSQTFSPRRPSTGRSGTSRSGSLSLEGHFLLSSRTGRGLG